MSRIFNASGSPFVSGSVSPSRPRVSLKLSHDMFWPVFVAPLPLEERKKKCSIQAALQTGEQSIGIHSPTRFKS
jgi:hypothetical protein